VHSGMHHVRCDRPPPGIRARLPLHRPCGKIDRHDPKGSAVAAGLLSGDEPLVEPFRPLAHRRRRVAGEDEVPARRPELST